MRVVAELESVLQPASAARAPPLLHAAERLAVDVEGSRGDEAGVRRANSSMIPTAVFGFTLPSAREASW